MTAPIVFLDTETDGLHPGRKAWEIAMIRRDGDREERIEFFLDIDLATADLYGLKVGKFYDRHPLGKQLSGWHLNDAPTSLVWENADWRARGVLTRDEAAMRVARWTHGAHIVGLVPHFDTEVLAGLLRDAGFTPAWHYHLIDVGSMMLGHLSGGSPAATRSAEVSEAIALPWKSENLSRVIGIEPPTEERRHTAMGDAEWAREIFDRVTDPVF